MSLLGDQEGDPREGSPEKRDRFEGAMERPLGDMQNQRRSERQWDMGVGGAETRRMLFLPSPTRGSKVLISSQHGHKPGFGTLCLPASWLQVGGQSRPAHSLCHRPR